MDLSPYLQSGARPSDSDSQWPLRCAEAAVAGRKRAGTAEHTLDLPVNTSVRCGTVVDAVVRAKMQACKLRSEEQRFVPGLGGAGPRRGVGRGAVLGGSKAATEVDARMRLPPPCGLTRTGSPGTSATRTPQLTARGEVVDDDTRALARWLADRGMITVGQPATAANVAAVERRVGLTIPASYRDFLMTFGWVGFGDAYISGIFADEPDDENFGTIIGDTFRLRELMDLPAQLLVVKSGDDEVPWCLDTAKSVDGEPPIVTFDRGEVAPLYPGFDAFFARSLQLWAEDSS